MRSINDRIISTWLTSKVAKADWTMIGRKLLHILQCSENFDNEVRGNRITEVKRPKI